MTLEIPRVYEPSKRMPIAMATLEAERIYVVCDDGSFLSFDPTDQTWTELAPIPGSVREEQRETKEKSGHA